MSSSAKEVTQLLMDWGKGDAQALNQLMPLVYNELHRIAGRYLRNERPNHTLQTTALINEAYVRIVDGKSVKWQDRAHFFGVAAQIMRHILVDHARSSRSAKRGGGVQKLTLDEAVAGSQERNLDLVALNDSLNSLAQIDPQQSRIIELRFFGGLTIEETAEVMSISPATVKRDWNMAKAWLYGEINRGGLG